MSPGSRLMAGIRYSEVFLFMASTSANRLGSKVARETRTTAVAGNDSVMVILVPSGNYITMYNQNTMNHPQTKVGRPRDPALDPAILSAAARHLGDLGYARMSLEAVA